MLTMEEAMKQTGELRFAAGNIVKGTIIEVRPKEVLVDIGYKSEGVIPANEFEDIKVVKIGDVIDVLIEKLEDKDARAASRRKMPRSKRNGNTTLTLATEAAPFPTRAKPVSTTA